MASIKRDVDVPNIIFELTPESFYQACVFESSIFINIFTALRMF
jgi:hypothetical protein